MVRRGLLAAVFAVSAAAVSVAPASAIGLPPPGENLTVVNYYDGPAKRNLVGQKWFGCPGQDSGQSGRQTQWSDRHWVPC